MNIKFNTTNDYLDWIKNNNKGKDIKKLSYKLTDLKLNKTHENIIDINMNDFEHKVEKGFYSSYIYAAIDSINFSTIINSKKLSDTKRIKNEAYLSETRIPIFNVIGIDDTDKDNMIVFLEGQV